MFDAGETELLPPEAYSADAGARVYAALAAKAQRVIAAGQSALVDAVYARPEERAAIGAIAARARLRGLFLVADLATRTARVGARRNDASDADANIAREQETYDLGEMDWTVIDASGTPEDTLQRARAALAS